MNLMARLPSLGMGTLPWLLCLMLGCGGGGGTAGNQVVNPAPPPPPAPKPVAVAAAPAAPKAVPVAAGNQAAQTKAATKLAQESSFPGEPDSDVFVAADSASFVAVPSPAVPPEDRMAVAVGVSGVNSSQFQVANAVAAASGVPRQGWNLPEGFQAAPEFGYNQDGYPLRIRGAEDGKLMAFVPGGTVRVGSNAGPPETSPEFVVFLDPFYMDVTEVTVGEFERYRQSLRDAKKRAPQAPTNANAGRMQPALGLAWGDVNAYARWAKKELPTEAEFEKAARGSDGFLHPWGNGRPVWSRPREVSTITDVGQFSGDVSPFGIYDLAGNAREWLHDWYVAESHQEAARIAARQTLTNWPGPKKPSQGSQRVVKGSGPGWEVWYRRGHEMHERLPDVGFRGVLRISPTATPVRNTAG